MVWEGNGGAVVLNFNGEIYNHNDIKKECEQAARNRFGVGISWRGTSDTEAVLWSYILWGDACFELLDGMFAIAIWDGRSRRLILARDRFGVKPLYYIENNGLFAFASEIKALLKLDRFDVQIDPCAVAQYVNFLFTPGERTMLASVRKLEPGVFAVFDDKKTMHRKSFAASYRPSLVDDSYSENAAADRLRSLLDQAVERQMMADVPVGAFLSGGLDSSGIVALARQYASNGQIECFTIGYEGGGHGWADDLPYAERVARYLNVNLNTVWVGPDMASQFSWMVQQLDEPSADPAALNTFFICQLARQRGIKVLLSGAGGDDLFSGYRRHRALNSERFWSWMPQFLRAGLGASARAISQGRPIGRRYAKAFQYADESEIDRLIGYFRWLPSGFSHSIFSDAVREEIKRNDPAEPMMEAIGALPKDTDPLRRMLHLDGRYFLVDQNLNYTDKMSMASGVEVRVPFLDTALAKFAASLPPKYLQRGGVSKWILRRALEPVLPQEVINRSKTGFGVPLRAWLQNELREEVSALLSESRLRRRGLFCPRAVSELVQLDRAGRLDATYVIFAIMCVETWCDRLLSDPG
jgi:asparagine synthase (glutamine-hydrolysing)